MTELRNTRHSAFQALLIIGGLAPALLCADAVMSPSMAQKEQFERKKPHTNVGTIEQQGEHPANLATEQEAIPTIPCCDNMSVDSVRNFNHKPKGRVQRRPLRIRPRQR